MAGYVPATTAAAIGHIAPPGKALDAACVDLDYLLQHRSRIEFWGRLSGWKRGERFRVHLQNVSSGMTVHSFSPAYSG